MFIKPLIELGRVQLGRKAVADNPQGHQALAEVITPTQEQYEATWGPDSMTMWPDCINVHIFLVLLQEEKGRGLFRQKTTWVCGAAVPWWCQWHFNNRHLFLLVPSA